MIDFGALPPEINSGRIWANPMGEAPLVAAAAAWTSLAAELGSTAAAFEAVTDLLVAGSWFGPSSAAMAAAAKPYVTWVLAEAALCGERGLAATNAAALVATTRTGHIHPTLVAENRAELAALVASNFLGVNTPAIMANEARYGEMWAQDAAAMYGYAGGSAAITGSMFPDLPAASATDPSGLSTMAAAAGDAAGQDAGQAGTTVSGASSQLGSMTSGLSSAMNAPSSLLTQAPQVLSSMASPLGSMTNMFGGMMGGFGSSPTSASFGNLARFGSSPVSASMGRGMTLPASGLVGRSDGASMSRLSVPSSWAGAVERETTTAKGSVAALTEEEEGTSMMAAPRAGMMPAGMGANSSPGGVSTLTRPKQRNRTVVPYYP